MDERAPAPARHRASGVAALSWLRQWLGRRSFRETARLRAFPPADLFQPVGRTGLDRYPRLFGFARELIGDGRDVRVLSFGCSTGEEAVTLRRYFPQADIVGIDASARRIAQAEHLLARGGGDAGVSFIVGGSADDLAPDSVDAVFAMAVFRHGDLNSAPPSCTHRLRFADFDRIVSGLACCVKPGGLLVLRHANFAFIDTAIAENFETLLELPRNWDAPLYDATGRRVADAKSEAVVFRRR